jgi:hypothetical protein
MFYKLIDQAYVTVAFGLTMLILGRLFGMLPESAAGLVIGGLVSCLNVRA